MKIIELICKTTNLYRIIAISFKTTQQKRVLATRINNHEYPNCQNYHVFVETVIDGKNHNKCMMIVLSLLH